MTQPPRLLEQVSRVARLKHFSPKTEKSYLYYIKDFILFHNKRHPRDMGVSEIRSYLSYLAAVYLPYALERKYPKANREWGWQYVFPAANRSVEPLSGVVRRHHILEYSLQRAVKTAIQKARIAKHGSCHTFRHSFATALLPIY